MNLGMIFILIAVTLYSIGTMTNDEEVGKHLRNAAFGFYGMILILMMGGII